MAKTVNNPRYFQGSLIWDLWHGLDHRVCPAVMVLAITHFR